MAWLFVVCCCIAALTIWVFPHHYVGTVEEYFGTRAGLPTASVVVLIVRNFAYFGFVIWLGRAFFRRPAGVLR